VGGEGTWETNYTSCPHTLKNIRHIRTLVENIWVLHSAGGGEHLTHPIPALLKIQLTGDEGGETNKKEQEVSRQGT